MLYPKFLTPNSVIGITAPSAGVGDHLEFYERSLQTLRQEGYQIKETQSVRNQGITSTTGIQRAQELDELVTSPLVTMILCASGGDFLMEMLPFVNWDHIQKYPKWIMGYSDPTSLLYFITTKLDIATLYGCNAGSYDQEKLHPCLKNNLEILSGHLVIQQSFDYYQKDWNEGEHCYHLTEVVYWETIHHDVVDVRGRMIGGCIECLKDLIGTVYDGTKDFVEKYQEDGILWYFDVCSQSAENFYQTLFQMKEAGWFEHIRGVIVGRVAFPKSFYADFTYQEALYRVFPELPIIFNADIGHLPPKMTIINGSMAHITCKDGKGLIEFDLI